MYSPRRRGEGARGQLLWSARSWSAPALWRSGRVTKAPEGWRTPGRCRVCESSLVVPCARVYCTDFNCASNMYSPPRFVWISIWRLLHRTMQGLPSFDRITARVSAPSFQSMSTSNPSRAHRPFTDPVAHAFGSAGSRSTILTSDFRFPISVSRV